MSLRATHQGSGLVVALRDPVSGVSMDLHFAPGQKTHRMEVLFGAELFVVHARLVPRENATELDPCDLSFELSVPDPRPVATSGPKRPHPATLLDGRTRAGQEALRTPPQRARTPPSLTDAGPMTRAAHEALRSEDRLPAGASVPKAIPTTPPKERAAPREGAPEYVHPPEERQVVRDLIQERQAGRRMLDADAPGYPGLGAVAQEPAATDGDEEPPAELLFTDDETEQLQQEVDARRKHQVPAPRAKATPSPAPAPTPSGVESDAPAAPVEEAPARSESSSKKGGGKLRVR